MTAILSSAINRLAVLGLLGVIATAPVLAQTAPEEVPVIDFGALLEEPVAAPGAVIAPDPPPPIPERFPEFEVPDDALLTLPMFDRSDAAQIVPESPADEVLLPLQSLHPTLDGIVRLTGEVQREDFFIELPAAAAARDVVLSYRNAINVLPEQSRMLIRINGVDLEPLQPDAFEGFVPLILPGGLFVAGRNEISVQVEHAHRIFCGPDATFAVWTEINTNTSGVKLLRRDLPDDATGLLMALRAEVAQSGRLAVRMGDDMVADGILEALGPRLTGLRGGGPVALVPELAYAVIEGAVPMSRVSVRYGTQPGVDVRRVGDGAIVMLLTVGYDGALPDLDALLPLPAPVPNIALLAPGTATPLRELGFDRPEAFNRYTEQSITFGLPDDWLLLASQKAVLKLGYSFADGMPKGALMLIKVNGTTIRMLPLDREGGKIQPLLDVDFRARLLRPGANGLTFVTIVPGDPPDLPCPPIMGPLTIIGASSTLLVPPSPKMQTVDIARPLVALQPDQIGVVSTTAADMSMAQFPAVLAAAMRPVAQVALLDDASLTIVTVNADAQIDLSELGISRRDLVQLFPAANAPGPTPAAEGETDQPGYAARISTGVKDAVHAFVQLAVPDDGSLASWLQGRRAEALVFIPRADNPQAAWLMVRPQSDPQRIASILSQARLSADGPRGRFALLTPEGTWQSWHTTQTAPQLLEPLSVANFRTVAGNYASWSPMWFGVLLLVLTLVSVGLALVFVISTRGTQKR